MSKIKKGDIADATKTISHIVLNSDLKLVKELHQKHFKKDNKTQQELFSEYIDAKVIVGGVEFDLVPYIEEFNRQTSNMIERKALNILKESIVIEKAINDLIKEEVRRIVDEKLNNISKLIGNLNDLQTAIESKTSELWDF